MHALPAAAESASLPPAATRHCRPPADTKRCLPLAVQAHSGSCLPSDSMDDHDGMPDFADSRHGLPRLAELWSRELEEAPVSMALSPKGQLLAVGTVDDAITVLEVAGGTAAHTLAGHAGGTNGVAFLSGNSLVSVGEDGAARVWNVARGTCLHALPVDSEAADRSSSGSSVNHLTVAHGGKAFACASGRLVTIFTPGASAQEAPAKRVLGPLDGTVESLRFDSRGSLLATYNGGCSFWRLADRSQEEKQELPLPYSGACLCGDVRPGMDYIVAGCHDSTVHIYHLKAQKSSGVELQEMSCGGYDSKVTAVDFNPAGNRLASSGGDKNTVWDFSGPPTGTMPTLAIGHVGPITCQAWQPDLYNWLATAGKDGRLFIYDVDNKLTMGEDMPFLCQPGAIGVIDVDEVTCLIFARQGLLYTGHISGNVRKWELPFAGDSDEEREGQAAAPANGQQQQAAAEGA